MIEIFNVIIDARGELMSDRNGDSLEHSRVSDELASEIRKKAIEEVSKYAVAAAVAFIAIAGTGWWFYLKTALPGIVGGVPVNAVIAFDDRAGCSKLGDAWEDAGFGGKTIIGAIREDKIFQYGFSAGHPSVTLGAENMPEIFLGIEGRNYGDNLAAAHPTSIGYVAPSANTATFLRGGNAHPAPIDLYPPYEVLYLCRKVK